MKKKTGLLTIAGLTAATIAFLKFSEDVPIDVTPPGPPPPPKLPGPYDECPEGFSRKLIDGQWRCWPKGQ